MTSVGGLGKSFIRKSSTGDGKTRKLVRELGEKKEGQTKEIKIEMEKEKYDDYLVSINTG